LIGTVVPVTITDIGTNTLFGALVQPDKASALVAAGAET
jgi:hypothetical protein